ncbi:uncharacterized protein PV09_03826 [Verruconis gallopava]|uniref:DUF647 domain-containing protein n=1 Tax=Verruconis gallopava TaxID=253628 RepID=A0A0D1XRI5_9PEZI|nr:uncharacterized protein PV09_03826 [Verruconis gallopava]KIW05301.1 hypothetical protein PV09_03826 [Verruconis gallopava]
MELKEFSESGKLVTRFVESKGQLHVIQEKDVLSNAEIEKKQTQGFIRKGLEIFLPAGYPHTVSPDYLPYKIYDTLQTLSSAIAGLLANRAVLQGVGVGDATASPTGALLLSIFQDSAGRIATILFAHRLGSSIEPECKRYRLAADVFNDAAMIADCLSPAFPKALRIMVLCTASIMRALCGVAAGSSKATLTAHFARSGNLGELNAKDASQGNAISLLGMLLGSIVVSYITSPLATWIAMLLLLTAHLSLNYAAVRAVSMQTLNRQRANILFSNLIAHDIVLTPREVSQRERIFESDGVLRWADDHVLGSARIGSSFREVARNVAAGSQKTLANASHVNLGLLKQLLDIFEDEDYVIWLDTKRSIVFIVLKREARPSSQLQAWCQALLLISDEGSQPKAQTASPEVILDLIAGSLTKSAKLFAQHRQHIINAGWNIDSAALETQSSLRLVSI